jgi:hypothetical protein
MRVTGGADSHALPSQPAGLPRLPERPSDVTGSVLAVVHRDPIVTLTARQITRPKPSGEREPAGTLEQAMPVESSYRARQAVPAR